MAIRRYANHQPIGVAEFAIVRRASYSCDLSRADDTNYFFLVGCAGVFITTNDPCSNILQQQFVFAACFRSGERFPGAAGAARLAASAGMGLHTNSLSRGSTRFWSLYWPRLDCRIHAFFSSWVCPTGSFFSSRWSTSACYVGATTCSGPNGSSLPRFLLSKESLPARCRRRGTGIGWAERHRGRRCLVYP